jgi:hypothetical protein
LRILVELKADLVDLIKNLGQLFFTFKPDSVRQPFFFVSISNYFADGQQSPIGPCNEIAALIKASIHLLAALPRDVSGVLGDVTEILAVLVWIVSVRVILSSLSSLLPF